MLCNFLVVATLNIVVEQGERPTKPRGFVSGMQGDGSTTELGGIMEVAMLGFDLAWV
jgi:hypothetical protein